MEEKYYRIKQLAELVDLPIRTLHYYDEVNLLKPALVDEKTNYRYYTLEQLNQIHTIKFLKSLGFSIKEMKQILKEGNLSNLNDMMVNKSNELNTKIRDLQILRDRFDNFFNTQSKESEVILKEIPKNYIVYSRYTGKATPDEFPKRYAKLQHLIKKHKLTLISDMKARFYIDYKNYDINHSDIEVFADVLAKKEIKGVTRLEPAFLAVSILHKGAYKNEHKSYKKLLDWCQQHGYTTVGPAIEHYIIDLLSTSNQDEYITELIIPVEKN